MNHRRLARQPELSSQGLRPISDAAHKAGMKFLLWIEPERAKYGTPVTLEHPEWFLRKTKEEPKPNDDLLLNLGNPEAWQWVVETVSSLIDENGIDCYREDFNIDPAPFWRNADEADRQGMAEMRFVEGLYAFWDELRRRHPGLLIDNCASGGRRLDLETIGRSVALWRTDYNCFPLHESRRLAGPRRGADPLAAPERHQPRGQAGRHLSGPFRAFRRPGPERRANSDSAIAGRPISLGLVSAR